MTDPHPPKSGAKPPAKKLGREAPTRLRRFYDAVGVKPVDEKTFAIVLDNRPARTPAKHRLVTPIADYTEAIAEEWRRQESAIVPSTMPLTTITCSTIDVVQEHRAHVAGEIANYASNDHLYYRTGEPAELARRQETGWDPILAWAAQRLATSFKLTTGLMPIEQSPQLKATMLQELDAASAYELAALHVITTLTGSALLALAVWHRRLDIEAAWHLAHIDEDWQINRWGHDFEAQARRNARHLTACAASRILGFFAT